MVAEKLETLAKTPTPTPRLKIVRGTTSDLVPIPPISPATPLVDRRANVIFWQLQFDFTKPLQEVWQRPKPIRPPKPNEQPKSDRPKRPRPDPDNARILPTVDLTMADETKRSSPSSSGSYLGKSQSTTEIIPPETEAQRLRGIQHRDLFMEMVCNPRRYHEMSRIARGEVIKWLNKSQTLRGLQPWEEEQLYKDHLADTIIKVGNILEGGRFSPKDNGKPLGENLLGYFYVFLKMDAPRFVRALDMKAIKSIAIDHDDDDDTEHRTSLVGALAMEMAEVPQFMEGNWKAFAEFVQNYIFEWTFRNINKTEEDILDASFFRIYYGTNAKIKEIKEMTGHNQFRINVGYKAVLEYVKAHVSISELAELFGRKIVAGCDC